MEKKRKKDGEQKQEEKNKKSKSTQDIEEDKVEKQSKEQNKILKKVLVGIGLLAIIILFGVIAINSARNFEYRGITGNVIKEGDIIFYQTSLPVHHKGDIVPYNFYLRNDPRSLEKDVPFRGKIILLDNMVVNSTSEFVCDGYGSVAMANFITLYKIMGTNIIKDPEATCDSEARYIFIQLQEADESSIEQVGPACYNFNINNCEILEVMERFMVETFIKAQEII